MQSIITIPVPIVILLLNRCGTAVKVNEKPSFTKGGKWQSCTFVERGRFLRFSGCRLVYGYLYDHFY